jgi:8-oxo-dGTP diphosphatase
MDKIPQVGVAMVVWDPGRNAYLVGQRGDECARGKGTWAFPGGRLEFMEDPEECAFRELEEETGIPRESLSKVASGPYVSNYYEDGTHFVTLFVLFNCLPLTEAKIMEPTKCLEWRWCKLHEIPKPWFNPLASFLDRYDELRP